MRNVAKNTPQLDVFWDLDGVIYKYDKDDYVGENPAYMQPKYFEDRPVDARGYIEFIAMWHNRKVTGLWILSKGANPEVDESIREAILKDKETNVRRRMPWFEMENVILTEESKVAAAERKLGRNLRKTDVLVDDNNDNLEAWVAAGGSAIKYINDINSVDTYAGPKLVGFTLVDIPECNADMYASLDMNLDK